MAKSQLELRAEIDTENARALIAMNGGAAAALVAFLPQVLKEPAFDLVTRGILTALMIFVLGLGSSFAHNRLRRKCSLYWQAHGMRPPFCSVFGMGLGAPCICFWSISFMWFAAACFLVGAAAVIYGALNFLNARATVIPVVLAWCAPNTLCYEMAKGFPAAIVALVIGAIAGYIAWRQYRATRAKIKLDLFDKRYVIFEEAWKFLSETAHQGGGVNISTPFTDLLPRSGFLFGPEVEQYLSLAAEKRLQLRAIEVRARSNNNIMLPEDIEAETELTEWFIAQASTGLKQVVAPYLDFANWR